MGHTQREGGGADTGGTRPGEKPSPPGALRRERACNPFSCRNLREGLSSPDQLTGNPPCYCPGRFKTHNPQGFRQGLPRPHGPGTGEFPVKPLARLVPTPSGFCDYGAEVPSAVMPL